MAKKVKKSAGRKTAKRTKETKPKSETAETKIGEAQQYHSLQQAQEAQRQAQQQEQKQVQQQPQQQQPLAGRDYMWYIIIAAVISLAGVMYLLGNNSNSTGSIVQDLEISGDVVQSVEQSDFLILTDFACAECDADRVKNIIMQKFFFNTMPRYVDSNSKEGKGIIRDNNVKVLPAYFFTSQIEQELNFNATLKGSILLKRQELYQLNPQVSEAVDYIELPRHDELLFFGLNVSNATVTLYEFSDFECPFCAQATATVKRILGVYPEVKVGYYPILGHQNSLNAATAAECAAEQDRFLPYHDVLFTNQNDLSKEALIKYAQQVGIPQDEFEQCLESGKYTAKIERLNDEARDFGIAGTPTFVVGNKKLANYEYETIAIAIENLLGLKSNKSNTTKGN